MLQTCNQNPSDICSHEQMFTGKTVSDYISCQRQSMKTKDTASQCIDVDHSYDK
jgi:hypothetical protein